MLGISLFRSAGATGYVITRSGSASKNRGVGWSGLIGPTTTVAVVPTTPRIIPFSVEVYTRDKQQIRVTGNVQALLEPKAVANTFDFTVDRFNGHYIVPWQPDLQAIIAEQVLGPIRITAAGVTIVEAVTSQALFEQNLQASIANQESSLVSRGIRVSNCSVAVIEPSNGDVRRAIGAEELQALLIRADSALHGRQAKAAENSRELQQYEAQTKLELEKAREELVRQQGENQVRAAEAEAKATEARLEPLTAIDQSRAMAVALLLAAQAGSLTNLSLTTELLALLRQEINPPEAGAS